MQGVVKNKEFFGLKMESQFDVLSFLVEEHLSRDVLETIISIGEFDSSSGTGIAFQIETEDAAGVFQQIKELNGIVEERI